MRCIKLAVLISVALMIPALARTAEGGGAGEGQKVETKAQTTCPVMGGGIDKSIHADHEGKRVYFCCKGCIETFKKDPAAYVKKLEDSGVVLDKVCACGHVKGAEECRKACAAKAGCKSGCGNAPGSEGCKKACSAKKVEKPAGCCPGH